MKNKTDDEKTGGHFNGLGMVVNRPASDFVRYREFLQPVNELAYVGIVVIAYWDGKDKDTAKLYPVEVKLPYLMLEKPPTKDVLLKKILEAGKLLARQYNISFLTDMVPIELYGTFDEKGIKEHYA